MRLVLQGSSVPGVSPPGPPPLIPFAFALTLVMRRTLLLAATFLPAFALCLRALLLCFIASPPALLSWPQQRTLETAARQRQRISQRSTKVTVRLTYTPN